MGLTRARELLVDGLADPTINTIRGAAKHAGITEQAAYVALKDVEVTKAIAKRKERLSDKARGEVAASRRIRKLVQRRLNSLDFDKLDEIEVVAVAHKTLEMRRLELEIEAKYPDRNSAADGLTLVDAHTQRCIGIGRYLEARSRRNGHNVAK